VHIEWIQLVDFRNYRTLSYSPTSQLNVVAGRNGHGKTNLLESLAVLLIGRSFRGVRAAELCRWDTALSALSGEVRRGDAGREIRREIRPREDGTWIVVGEGCPWARVIPFTWQDLAVLNGSPEARRSFLDGFAGKIVPAHLTARARYRQIVIRRNSMLQRGEPGIDRHLEAWDEQLVTVGLELIRHRRAAVASLEDELARIHARIGGQGATHLIYQCLGQGLGQSPGGLGSEITAEEFRRRLAARRPEELRRGQTLVGPHRDDLVIEVDGRDMRRVGSRGQQRLLALALRLAEVEPVAAGVGTAPVLLLDDALSELDPDVQRRVLDHVEGQGQVFLSTADGSLPTRAASWWRVDDHRVEETSAEAMATAMMPGAVPGAMPGAVVRAA